MTDPTVSEVDDQGVALGPDGDDRALDVLFDGRRIWSFWSVRDTEEVAEGGRCVAWPDRMRRFLDGESRVVVRDHVAGTVLFSEDLSFGDGEGRIAFVNKQGLLISLDNTGRFHPEFSVRTEDQLAPLLNAMHRVIALLAEQGVEAFPAYGTLLGAVREHDFLGHDTDADLGYVSRHSTPVDVIRESFQLQRALSAHGLSTFRYSGGAFRIDVQESDGTVRGLDLFGGFLDRGEETKLYLLGEVGVPFEPEWIFPLSRLTMAGHEFPGPAQPERLLEAMYGAHWRVPDPAYQFATPQSAKVRLDGWFRGLTVYRKEWQRNQAHRKSAVDVPLSSLAQRMLEDLTADSHVLDVGAGRGSDALHLARAGFRTTAYDYVPATLRKAARIARRQGAHLEVRELNLAQLRSVLGEGAHAARQGGPRSVLARHVLDATTERGRDGVLRFASMALRTGGRLYAEFSTGPGETDEGLYPVAVDQTVAAIIRLGGSVVSVDVEPGPPGQAADAVVIAEWCEKK